MEEKHNILRRLYRTDLYALLRYGLNRPDVDRQWLYERCREVQLSPDGHLDLWAREHYKSTIITFAQTIQDILSSHGDDPDPKWDGREPTFGIFSFTRPAAKSFLKQIKREFEGNAQLKELFPDVLYENPQKEAPKWSEDEGIIVKRKTNPKESTVEAWGMVDGQPTGKHFFGRIYDDVVTRESVTTADMVKKTTESWELSINLGSDGGFERYIGTRYSDLDSYSVMMERGAVIPRIYAATDNGHADGSPVFLSDDALNGKRVRMGPYTFACQMLQNPVPDDNAFCRRDWFKRYKLGDHPKTLNIYGASDFAVTENDGDYTELGIGGFDAGEDLWLLDWWSGQKTADYWIDRQLDLTQQHNPLCWVGESGQIRRSIEPFLTKRMRQRRIYCRLEWITRNRDKVAMARSFQALASMGKVHIPNTPWGDELIAQLLRFPFGANDDKVDVCALFGLILDQTWAATLPQNETTTNKDDYWPDDEDDDSWKVA